MPAALASGASATGAATNGNGSDVAGKDSLFHKRKIAVLGSRSVGKSSLVIQFVDNSFNEQYFPTIENTFTKTIKHNGQDYLCDIIDTAGQDEYSLISSRLSIGIDGYVLVYSVTSRPSFELVREVHDKLVMQSGIADVPCVVVGQKGDLVDQSRQVPQAEGKKLADSMGAGWVETSARQNLNVDKVFDLALSEIEKKNPSANARKGDEKGGCCIM
ncbi:ras-domain-containing protein [Clavulina sp. PMI_390]|nr:ras-domain-containing protein [Clavulina sp. PMI_390]